MSLLQDLPKSNVEGVLFDAETVHELLPQKAPFAFVDEILSIDIGGKNESGETVNPSIVARLNLNGNEDFFKGHFPGNPVMPGVLQVETMAQAATLLTKIALETEVVGKRPAFMGVEQCRFKNPVLPPASLIIKVSMLMARHCIFKYSGEIFQEDKLVCKADFSAAMV